MSTPSRSCRGCTCRTAQALAIAAPQASGSPTPRTFPQPCRPASPVHLRWMPWNQATRRRPSLLAASSSGTPSARSCRLGPPTLSQNLFVRTPRLQYDILPCFGCHELLCRRRLGLQVFHVWVALHHPECARIHKWLNRVCQLTSLQGTEAYEL